MPGSKKKSQYTFVSQYYQNCFNNNKTKKRFFCGTKFGQYDEKLYWQLFTEETFLFKKLESNTSVHILPK